MKIIKVVRSAAVIALSLLSTHAFGSDWSDLSSGKHSFKSLGPNFYKDVPVRRIPNATLKLTFVNREAVRRLGLELPSDPAAAEAMLLNHFGWEVDPDKKSDKVWFATHYLDSAKKEVGGALGDGRALWTGELKIERPDGKILYVDGVQKGVGPTPLAWTNNSTHSDGRQNTNELVISGIRSMADMGNELDSTADLLGFTITSASGDQRSMTLRVGRQTRPAHIRYHDDNTADETKMMDYIVKRDLGLPIETGVSDAMFIDWFKAFARNNAEDTARVFALGGFYEHPTAGNKTTTGGSIDLNGRQYLDAYHTNMTHLHGRMLVGKAVEYQRDYIVFIKQYLEKAGYRKRGFMGRSGLNLNNVVKEMQQIFDSTFVQTSAKLFLRSLGLDDAEIAGLKPEVRRDFYKAVDVLMRAQGNSPQKLILHNEVIPAAFDVRKIIKGTLAAMALPTREARTAAMAELYKNDYKWNTTLPTDHLEPRAKYEQAVMQVINNAGGKIRASWIANAANRVKLERYDATSEGIWDKWAHPIRLMAEAGKTSWTQISDLMEKAANTFVDKDPSIRRAGMLKTKSSLNAPTCSALFSVAG